MEVRRPDRNTVQLVTQFCRQCFHGHRQRPVVVMETDVMSATRRWVGVAQREATSSSSSRRLRLHSEETTQNARHWAPVRAAVVKVQYKYRRYHWYWRHRHHDRQVYTCHTYTTSSAPTTAAATAVPRQSTTIMLSLASELC